MVIVRTGNPGTCAYVPEELSGSNCSDLVIVRPDIQKVNPRYLEAFINTYGGHQIAHHKVGAIQKHFNVSSAQELVIAIPHRDDQDRIASLIQAINDKIANNKKLMTELEATACLIYDYWFTQFDFPDENGSPYRSSGGPMVYNDTLCRDIPAGWKVGALGDLGTIVSGATPSTSEESYYAHDGIAWITPNDLADSLNPMHVWRGARSISRAGFESCSAVMMPPGSIIMSSRAPIGYLAVASSDCCTNQGCKSLIPSSSYGTYFVFFSMQRLMPLIKSQGVGTTFTEVSKETLASVPLALPPSGLARGFEKRIAPSCKLIMALEQEGAKLTALRNWLLPMLMNGQVSVGGHSD